MKIFKTVMRWPLAAILMFGCLSVGMKASVQTQSTKARLITVIVVDGLRPDSINDEDTPNLFRLRREGIAYINSHSVFPTVTRVNAAALSTGTYPIHNGLVSNVMYVPGVDPVRPFNTGDYRQLLKMQDVSNGTLLFRETLGERLQKAGLKYVAVSSGSTGNALLLNSRAPSGIGVVINGSFDPGKTVAYPADISKTILSRFGEAPTEERSPRVDWTEKVLREYVLPELHPDVLIDWLTEPDTSQHEKGAGSVEARAALKNSDRNIGLFLKRLEELGLADKTDIIVLSDHGFTRNGYGINLTEELVNAKLKASANSDDVVLASNGNSVLLHVKGKDKQRIKQIVEFLQKQSWSGSIFTDQKPAAAGQHSGPNGWVEGTFSLDLIHEGNPERGPDIMFTFLWNSAPNASGMPGTDYINSRTSGPLTGEASGHGSISPYTIRNTMLMWGPDFKSATVIRTPSANVDVMPTILALKNLPITGQVDGRVLREAFRDGGVDEEQVITETSTLTTQAGDGYKIAIQLSRVGSSIYVDKSWRVR